MKTPETEIPRSGSLSRILDSEVITADTDRRRVNMDSFRNAKYCTDSEVDDDIRIANKLRKDFEEKRKNYSPEKREQDERGKAAEYTFREAIANYDWLAKNVNVIVTSLFDDYKRGIDSVAQIVMGPDRFEHLGFAIDFASGTEDVGVKLRHTFDTIDQGSTPSVKYFESEKTGKLKNFKIPRIVVGASPETLERLATYSSEIMNSSGMAESAKEEIRRDSFRAVLFGEIEAQLGVFINRIQKVIDQAKREKRTDIEEKARGSLAIHKRALEVTQELSKAAGITLEIIHKHIRGDIFANKMGQALSALTYTPIVFKKQNNLPNTVL